MLIIENKNWITQKSYMKRRWVNWINFLDANKDVVLGSFKIEGSALQKEADKALAKYNQAIQQYQMAKMRLQRTKTIFHNIGFKRNTKNSIAPKTAD